MQAIAISTQLPEGLIKETIAYDGPIVYVPAYKSQNLPSALQGKITLAQLQQIFTVFSSASRSCAVASCT